MKRLFPGLLFLFLVVAAPALAIDPGVAQGSLQADATRAYKLTHAYAFRDKKELRIVLSDREAPQSVLPDLNFLAVAQAAREDKLHGLIVQVNPIDQKSSTVTVLHASVFSRHTGGLSNLSFSGTRVIGEIDSGTRGPGQAQYRAKFSAPIFTPGAKR